MKYLLTIFGAVGMVLLVLFGMGRLFGGAVAGLPVVVRNDDLALVVEPDAGIAPVLRMIGNASATVDLVMYEFADEDIERALIAAKDRGVAVRVLLSQGYYGEPSGVNSQAYEYLASQGVAVKWTPAYFALTHQKTMIVDGDFAMIMTFNLMPQYYATSRDFGIMDDDQHDDAAIEAAFDADWEGSHSDAAMGDDLIWSPGSEAETVALIDAATSTLEIYNEEMADDAVTRALESAAERGVTVRVVMTYATEWKSVFQALAAAGVQVRTFSSKAPLYIHAKMILADGQVAFVGSQNFSETSQQENRELGIMMTNAAIVQSLDATFNGDWKSAMPFQ